MPLPLLPLALGAGIIAALALASGKSGGGADLDANMPDDLKKKVTDMIAHELQPTTLEAEAASAEIAGNVRGGPFPKAQAALRLQANLLFQTPKVGAFDPGMTPEESQAVATALSVDNDPSRLRRFAATMRSLGFKNAAGLLEAKANRLDELQRGNVAPGAPPVFVPPPPVFVPPTPVFVPPTPVFVPPTPGFPLPTPVFVPPSPSQPLPIPAFPIPFPAPGSQARVATHDAGAAGALNLRSAPSTSATSIGMLPKDSIVTIVGEPTNGFFLVRSDVLLKQGFASGQFLAPANVAPAGAPAPVRPVIDLTPILTPAFAPPFPAAGSSGIVTTHDTGPSGDLNLRFGPSSSAAVIGKLPHASSVTILGQQTSGFYPVRAGSGATGFASAQFIGPAPSTTAGFAGTVSDDLHQAALALDTALKTGTCRATNEPVVRRFQSAAKRAGLYSGALDGWYGTQAQAALGSVVGNPSPPCFPEPTGGPVNPNTYWSPAAS